MRGSLACLPARLPACLPAENLAGLLGAPEPEPARWACWLARAGLGWACVHALGIIISRRHRRHCQPPRTPAHPASCHAPLPPPACLPACLPACSLGYLVNKNRGEQLQEVVGALCSKLLTSNKEQLRDVASLGLKTVVAGGWVLTGFSADCSGCSEE